VGSPGWVPLCSTRFGLTRCVGIDEFVVAKKTKVAKKINVRVSRPILIVCRIPLKNNRLVYALLANRKIPYPHEKSYIAYIGTTKKGLARIAQSAAWYAKDILNEFGVTSVTARIITCRPKKNVKTWLKLERAMLLKFREIYGAIPKCNRQGNKLQRRDEFKYFNEGRVRNVIRKLE
jgi:hypothetical protein